MSMIGKLTDKKNRMKYIYAKYFTAKEVDPRAVLFESFHGKEISDSPLAMARSLLASPYASEYDVWFSTNDISRDQPLIDSLGLDIKLVHIHSDKYAELLATAGRLINNSSFPSYLVRRDDQIYLQTWHGTPWKTLGKSMSYGIETMHNVQHNFLQASHLLFPNEFTRDSIMGDYELPGLFTGEVILGGYPRNSIFSRPDMAAVIRKQLRTEDKETICYMPTWRGKDNTDIQEAKETEAILKALDEALSDDQILYVNLHPAVQKSAPVEGYEHIRRFPSDVDKYEFINSTDALITDYSSIFFDYMITGKPVMLFTYDYDEYASERGLYFDISELPLRRIDTIEELAACIKDGSYKDFTYPEDCRFTPYDSAEASDKLTDYIFKGERGDLVIENCGSNADVPRRLIECRSVKTTDDLDEIADMAANAGDGADEAGPRSLVLFYQADFTPELSAYMHANYKDSFDYIFSTKSVPQTYVERFAKRRDKKIKEAVRRRDLLRRTGPLNIVDTVKFSSKEVSVTSVKISGTKCVIGLSCPASMGDLRGARLAYRSSVEGITHELSLKITDKEDGRVSASVEVDTSLLKAGCVYWDFFLDLEKDGETVSVPAAIRSRMSRILAVGFYQCSNKDSYITFPHITVEKTLAFTHREASPYDTLATSLKELLAYGTYRLFGGSLRRRNIWLVFEKFSSAAQDNGYYFFKYCMENLPPEERDRIYYVITKDSGDYANVAKYGRQVIHYMSFRHLLYMLAARLCVGSDSKKHLYLWRPKPNLISRRMRKKDIHFLQHGVTALKKVDPIFGVHGSSPMTSITTTSKYEQRIMTEHFGYTADEAPVVGFTRWDVLEDKSTPDDRIILVMPTWRAWLEEKTEEDFLSSDYFRNYSELLEDKSLLSCLEETGTRLIFFIHPKLKDFLEKFGGSAAGHDNIELVQFGSRPLNEIMMRCSMLVTDYSSVCWDVYYMGKPVIFYQFDYDMYMENHGSYMDMENELFGERYTELPGLIAGIRECIEGGFEESKKAKELRPEYFEFIDNDNSKRTYEYLKKRGY